MRAVSPSRFPTSKLAWLALLAAGLLTPSGVGQLLAQDAATVPSWRRGISRWNGYGYDEPVASIPAGRAAATVEPVTSGSPAPYTVPVDPNRSLPPQQLGSQRWAEASPGNPPSSQTVDPQGLPEPAALAGLPAAPSSITAEQLNPPANAVSQTPIHPVESSETESLEVLPAPIPDEQSQPATLGDALEAGVAIEEPPLEEEIVHWYQYPLRWMRGWDSHAEFGLDGSSGNADTLAIQTGFETRRQADLYTLELDLDYRQASNRGVTTANNGRFNVDYDRLLGESQWTGFTKFGMEWDQFKAFDLRLNLNSGIGYYWIRNDTTTLATRFGAGASREIGAPIDDWIPEAVFGLEAVHQINSQQKVKAKVDYFPAWENFGDYRIVTDLSWEILLGGSDNLSLKLAATDRYDSTPQGAEPNDIYYSLLLLYKF